MARSITARPVRLDLERGTAWSRRWRRGGWLLATAAIGGLLWYGASLDMPALPDSELSQPTAAGAPLARSALFLPGLASEPLDKRSSGSRRKTREERVELRKARKEAARAKREAAREARAARYQERREASAARREEARERRAEAAQARRERAEERREARLAKREAAREQYGSVADSRREKAEARREARLAKREAARERRAAAAQARRDAKEARRLERELAKAEREAAERAEESPAIAETSAFGAAARASASAPPPRNAGTLRINSRPWAQVFVDGRMVGYTPQRNLQLSAGDHAVELINPEFAMRKTLHVRIEKGKQVTRSELLED